MIRKYNDFVKGKVNEDLTMAEPRRSTERTTPEVMPGTTEKPGTMPSPPSPIRRERTSPVPAPAKMEVEQEEEEGGDKYKKIITDLAAQLGAEVSEDGTIDYNGQKINFYSETDMFHVGKKKFKTADEVVSYLETSAPSEEVEMKDHSPSKEDMAELMAAHDDDEFIKDDEEEKEEKFESKSYKSTRKFESFKNKNK
jgi:hypothetical protein